MYYYLIYTSRPRIPITKSVLEDITSVSQSHNVKFNITGMLLGVENRYVQYLEGEEESVRELYESIKKDKRHYDVKKWVQGFTDRRVFSEWSMGSWMLANSDLRSLSGLSELSIFLNDPGNRRTYASRFLEMMQDLLRTWIVHEPELAERQKTN